MGSPCSHPLNARERITKKYESLVREHGLDPEALNQYLVARCVEIEGLRVLKKIERSPNIQKQIGTVEPEPEPEPEHSGTWAPADVVLAELNKAEAAAVEVKTAVDPGRTERYPVRDDDGLGTVVSPEDLLPDT